MLGEKHPDLLPDRSKWEQPLQGLTAETMALMQKMSECVVEDVESGRGVECVATNGVRVQYAVLRAAAMEGHGCVGTGRERGERVKGRVR